MDEVQMDRAADPPQAHEVPRDQGKRTPIKIKDPILPTQAEVEEHEKTHMPYRNWCCHCIRGKGKSADHNKQKKDGEHTITEIHLDYLFLGTRPEPDTDARKLATVLGAKERDKGMTLSTVVPKKGGIEFAAKRLISFIDELGLSQCPIIMKSDQEPSIIQLIDTVKRLRVDVQTFMENSPVKSSQSNGIIERAAQSIEGHVRVMKSALEHRYDIKIKEDDLVLTWLIEYAGVLINRYEVGHDGKTPYERTRGKVSKMIGLEFGEAIEFRRQPQGLRRAKLESLWERGLFIGYKSQSGEYMIATCNGTTKTRTVKRVPVQERWIKENLDMITGAPWCPNGPDSKFDDIMPAVQVHMKEPEIPVQVPRCQEETHLPRRVYIRSSDIDKNGATPDCAGCKAHLLGKKAVHHSEGCRDRITKIMMDHSGSKKRVADADDRQNKFIALEIQKNVEMKSGTKDGGVKPQDDAVMQQSSSSSSSASPPGTEKRKREDDDPGDMKDDIPDTAMIQYIRPRWADIHANDDDINEMHDLWGAHEDDHNYNADNFEQINSIEEEVMHEHHDEHESYEDRDVDLAFDDVTGKPLKPELVQKARQGEVDELERLEVFDKVPIDECWRNTGKPPITARWLDINKGDDKDEVYRSRYVAREIKKKHGGNERENLFAATPPLEALKLLLSNAVTNHEVGKKIMLIDISKAYLFAPVLDNNIYVDLPHEMAEPMMCGRLKKALYGTRDAAHAWEQEYTQTLNNIGFHTGESSTCIFYHDTRQLELVVHGDDFTIIGQHKNLQWFAEQLRNKYIVKVRGVLGPDMNDMKEISILNRIVRWTSEGFEIEADPRHVELIFKSLEMTDAKGTTTPGIKIDDNEHEIIILDKIASTQYRSLAARCNYLAADRIDIQYAVKELCREMSSPTNVSWIKLKKLARYLQAHPRLVMKYKYQDNSGTLQVYSDTDFAGCLRTRRSTSGGCIMRGSHCIKSWSTTQAIVALSSGEAEYYGLTKAACLGIGAISLCKDFHIVLKLIVYTDSSAAKGIVARRGLGKLRHLDVQVLWLQERVQRKHLQVKKVWGKENPGDLSTKYLDKNTILNLLNIIDVHFMSGRSQATPQLQN